MTNFEIAKLKWKVAETAVKFGIIVGALMFNSQNFDKTILATRFFVSPLPHRSSQVRSLSTRIFPESQSDE